MTDGSANPMGSDQDMILRFECHCCGAVFVQKESLLKQFVNIMAVHDYDRDVYGEICPQCGEMVYRTRMEVVK